MSDDNSSDSRAAHSTGQPGAFSPSGPRLAVRPVPFPWSSVLAISSDLDGTRTASEYFELIRFLNRSPDACGGGLGLEFANSIYFLMPEKQFSYFGASPAARAELRRFVQAGLVDTVHSFGGRARSAEDVGKVLEEIDQHRMEIPVWTNHARVPTNMRELRGRRTGKGDSPDAPVYHAARSRELGMKYVWRSQVTSLVGQDARPDFLSPWRADHPVRSASTCLRQFGKSALGLVNRSWSLHASNRLLALGRLEDGTEIVEFMRCNPHWAGISAGESAAGLADVLSETVASALVRRGGTSIVYTHLAKKVSGQTVPIPDSAISALRRIAGLQAEGVVLVLTTARALDTACLARWVRVRSVSGGGAGYAAELSLEAPGFLRDRLAGFLPRSGLTLYYDGHPPNEIRFDGVTLRGARLNGIDSTGRPSVSLPLSRPEIPD